MEECEISNTHDQAIEILKKEFGSSRDEANVIVTKAQNAITRQYVHSPPENNFDRLADKIIVVIHS